MTVAELIARLEQESPHATVLVGVHRETVPDYADCSPSMVVLCPDLDYGRAWHCTCGALAIAEGACTCA